MLLMLLLIPRRPLQVINIVLDATAPAPAPASGLGLMSPPASAAPPSHPSPAVQPPASQHLAPAAGSEQRPLPPQPQQQPQQQQQQRPAAQMSNTSKYEGFGSDQFSGRGSDPAHKPLSSYFSNAPAPAPSQAAGPGTSSTSTAAAYAGAAGTPGNALAMMSDGIMSLGQKLSRVGVKDKPAATAPTPGGGSYTGPATPDVPGGVAAGEDRGGVTGGSTQAGTGYDRYGRPLGGTSAAHSGEMDLAAINQIIANLDGGNAPPPVPSSAPAPMPAPSGGGGGLGLSSSDRGGGAGGSGRPLPADDDARCLFPFPSLTAPCTLCPLFTPLALYCTALNNICRHAAGMAVYTLHRVAAAAFAAACAPCPARGWRVRPTALVGLGAGSWCV